MTRRTFKRDQREIKDLLRKSGATMDGQPMTDEDLNMVSTDLAENGQLENIKKAVADGAKLELMKAGEYATEAEATQARDALVKQHDPEWNRNRETPRKPWDRESWDAMIKFVKNEWLTESEWDALSYLSLIDRSRLVFEPGNVRWARTAAERADNLKFYHSLGMTVQ